MLLFAFTLAVLCGFAYPQISSWEGINLCADVSKLGPPLSRGLPDKMVREEVQSSAIVTDWIAKSTWSVVEVVHKERRAIQMNDRFGNVTRHFSAANGKMFQYKTQGNNCEKAEKPLTPYGLSVDSLTLLGATDKGSSLTNILAALVKLSEQRKHNSYLVDTAVMGGVENVRWITCVNATNASTNATYVYMFEAVYAGEWAVQPPTPIAHPLLHSLRIALFENATDPHSPVITHTSVEIDRYDVVKHQADDPLFSVPQGITCDGWPVEALPDMLPNDFYGIIQYTDRGRHQIKVHYSPTKKMAVVYGKPVDNRIPFFDEYLPTELDDVDAVVHDFKYGYEYALSQATCRRLSPLSTYSRDVSVTSGGVLTMPSLSTVLLKIGPKQTFGRYPDLVLDGYEQLHIYRGLDMVTNQVIEVRVRADDNSLHSVIRYDKNAQVMAVMEVLSSPSDPAGWTRLHTLAANCYAGAVNENGTYTMDIKSKSVRDVTEVGSEEVRWALAQALSTANANAPINPYRINAYFVNVGSNLRAIFSVAEKPTIEPANVGYNFTSEASTEKFIEVFNATITAVDWSFAAGPYQIWTVLAKSLSQYPPPVSGPKPSPTFPLSLPVSIFDLLETILPAW